MDSVEKTILSQYQNSPIICQLIKGMDAAIDPSADIENFYNLVWNVDTATDFGLEIWGRIVDISREVNVSSTVDKQFGFEEALPGSYPFGEGTFKSATSTYSGTISLPTESFRKLILAKALTNISASTIPAINKVLVNMFGDNGRVYVTQIDTMSIGYYFDYTPDEYTTAMITQTSAFLRPAGCLVTIVTA